MRGQGAASVPQEAAGAGPGGATGRGRRQPQGGSLQPLQLATSATPPPHLEVGAKGLKVDPRGVRHQLVHGGPPEGRAKVQHLSLVGQLQAAAHLLRVVSGRRRGAGMGTRRDEKFWQGGRRRGAAPGHLCPAAGAGQRHRPHCRATRAAPTHPPTHLRAGADDPLCQVHHVVVVGVGLRRWVRGRPGRGGRAGAERRARHGELLPPRQRPVPWAAAPRAHTAPARQRPARLVPLDGRELRERPPAQIDFLCAFLMPSAQHPPGTARST